MAVNVNILRDRHDNRKSGTTIWSVALVSSIMILEVTFTLLKVSCMVLWYQPQIVASLTIVIYNHNTLMLQAILVFVSANFKDGLV